MQTPSDDPTETNRRGISKATTFLSCAPRPPPAMERSSALKFVPADVLSYHPVGYTAVLLLPWLMAYSERGDTRHSGMPPKKLRRRQMVEGVPPEYCHAGRWGKSQHSPFWQSRARGRPRGDVGHAGGKIIALKITPTVVSATAAAASALASATTEVRGRT